jgi:multidrug efflux pump subunit AcrA (membrane-fusion protein)
MQQAEAEVRLAQAAYDVVRRENPAGIGGTPESATLEIKTIAFQAAQARLQAAQARLQAVYEKPNPGQYAELRAQRAAAQARINALRPVSETIVSSQALADQSYYAWQQAELALRDTRIIAPFDGLVTGVAMAAGDAAGANTTIQLADFANPVFEADVDEADLAKIKVGQAARVRLQTYLDTPFNATVISIGKVGRQSGSLMVYRVQLALGAAEQAAEESGAEPDEQAAPDPDEQGAAPPAEPAPAAEEPAAPSEEAAAQSEEAADPSEEASANQKPEILLNMSGIAQFVTDSSEDTLLAPATVLIKDPDSETYTVMVVRGEGNAARTEEVEVEIGLRNRDMVEIISGVNEGDTLVVPEPEDIPLEGPSVN